MINLFKLHDNTKDRGAYSWIVGNGPELFNNFEFLINQITEKSNYTVKDLSKKISKRIGCSTSMLYDILNGRTEWISLALISELLTILRELGTDEETTKLKSKFLDSIKFLKSAPRSSVKIQAVKKLSPELAEFCGIHAADGSLNLQISIETLRRERINKIKRELNNKFPKLRISRVYKRENKYRIFFNVTDKTRTKIFNYLNRYNINFTTSYKLEFIDLDKNSMEYLRKLIFILFGYYIKIKPREKEGGGYYVFFSNKVIGRYLKNIFNFPVGKKSDTVDVPKLIKDSSFAVQKAFARGLIQFDGSVKRNGKVTLSTNSKHLLDFFLSIIKRDNLKGAVWARKNRKKELTFESPSSKQWLAYFIKGTLKYQRLREHIYGFRENAKSMGKTLKIFDATFPTGSSSTLLFSKLIKTAFKLKDFTRYQISDKLGIHYKPLSVMLDILEKAKIIKIERVEMLDRFERKSDKITFNNTVETWRTPLLQNGRQ